MSHTSITPEVVHFARDPHDEPAELVLHGLAGVCDAMDELATNLLPDTDRRGRERIVGLALAARILSQQLVSRMMCAPVTPERHAEAVERLHAVA